MSTEIAVLALHLQNEIIHPDGEVGKRGNAVQVAARNLLANAQTVMNAARAVGAPVIHIGVGYLRAHPFPTSASPYLHVLPAQGLMQQGSWGASFHDVVAPQPGDAVLYHTGLGPFCNTGLQELLQAYGVRTLVHFGVSTRMVVEASVFEATDRGYPSIVVDDACAAAKPELHEQALDILRLFASVMPAADAARRFAAP
jgi:nicotinamidase-related amidase